MNLKFLVRLATRKEMLMYVFFEECILIASLNEYLCFLIVCRTQQLFTKF